MKSQQKGVRRSPKQNWSLPVNTNHYDRNPVLTSIERRMLKRYATPRTLGTMKQLPRLLPALSRLVKPIDDVLDHTKPVRCRRSYLVLYLLREMNRRERAFWGWTREQWIETINRRREGQHHIVALAYLLCGFDQLDKVGRSHIVYVVLARKVFGPDLLEAELERVRVLLAEWGYAEATVKQYMNRTVCEALLTNRSPRLEDLKLETLQGVERNRTTTYSTSCLVALSRVMARLGVIRDPLPIRRKIRWKTESPYLVKNVPSEWARLARHWFDTSPLSPRHRRKSYYFLSNVGRWLAHVHPKITSPAEWNRDLAARCVAMIVKMKCGDWTEETEHVKNFGHPMVAATKAGRLSMLRTFFRDLQDWELIPRRFDPQRTFATPKSLLAQIGPNPRVIADDLWAKLIWAGLNFRIDDLPSVGGFGRGVQQKTCYPFELNRALVVTWLFAGLRVNEILRLRVGCVRWHRNDPSSGSSENLPAESVCFLDVPVNKTCHAFAKPVDRLVGEAIMAWEKVRPSQAKLTDPKTGEAVDFLFLDRMRHVSPGYLNRTLIPMLCRKAGIPAKDVRGNITSHRARSTIASQLYNAKEPMTLFELQEWLGHTTPAATQHYAKITPTKLAKSYADAGYFGRNLRAVEVLIDQEAVRSGVAANERWKYYDLGHGYCTYDFFEKCPHRMACAKCAFYLPKQSSRAQFLEGRTNLLRLRQEIPLADAEVEAVNDGIAAHERLVEKLADVPTPAGPTPRELAATGPMQLKTPSVE